VERSSLTERSALAEALGAPQGAPVEDGEQPRAGHASEATAGVDDPLHEARHRLPGAREAAALATLGVARSELWCPEPVLHLLWSKVL